MELLTDILAIAGWSIAGFILPAMPSRPLKMFMHYLSAFSFGLIAASLVLE